MKFIWSILAIIILVLSCIPCSDAEVVAMEQTFINTTAKSTSQHKTDQEHKDLCSPFCQCSCCAVAYTIPLIPVTDVTTGHAFPDKIFAAYLQQSPVGITLPVWQPPKIVANC